MNVLKKDLRVMSADGAACSVMQGLGETYLPAFVLAVGLGEVAAGLIASVPLVAGALLQIAAPKAVEKMGSYRNWCVLCVAVQAAAFIPLAAAAIYGAIPVWAVFALASLYWGAGMASGPAWNAWAGTLIPTTIRARYFACRARLCQACILGATLLGGFSLQWGRNADALLWTFAVVFTLAAAARFVSAGLLAMHSEPQPPAKQSQPMPLAGLWKRVWTTNDGRLLTYMVAAQIGVQVSGPFFTPFMLKQLNFSYYGYVVLLCMALGAKIFSLCFVGRLAQKYGARRLLWIGGLAITPISSLWVFCNDFYYLAGVQVLSGLAWGVFELASFLVFFETVKTEERTSLMTWYNVANALAILCGSLLGGALLRLMGENVQGYLVLFAVSTLLRAGALVMLRPATRPLPASEQTAETAAWVRNPLLPWLATRTLAVRPSSGSIERPLLLTFPKAAVATALAGRSRCREEPASLADRIRGALTGSRPPTPRRRTVRS